MDQYSNHKLPAIFTSTKKTSRAVYSKVFERAHCYSQQSASFGVAFFDQLSYFDTIVILLVNRVIGGLELSQHLRKFT